MKVVVTGGAGFIGANLCRHLRAMTEIDEVIAVDDLSTGFRSNLEGVDVTLVESSIGDSDMLDTVCHDAGAIVHLAARPSVPRSIADPLASHHANATGTLSVLEAARRADRPLVITASSSSVYGGNRALPMHEGLAQLPLSPYAASKLAAEAYTLAYQHSYGLPTIAFRFFNVFGPLQAAGHAYAAVVPAFVSAALADQPLTIHGDGTQSRDFTYVSTVCEVIGDAVRRSVSSPVPVNLAFGSRTSLLEVASALEELLGHPLARVHTPPLTGDIPHSQAANDRLRALFPDATPTPLREGLASTIEWFRSTAAGDPVQAPAHSPMVDGDTESGKVAR